jgi:hypothetical protein
LLLRLLLRPHLDCCVQDLQLADLWLMEAAGPLLLQLLLLLLLLVLPLTLLLALQQQLLLLLLLLLGNPLQH